MENISLSGSNNGPAQIPVDADALSEVSLRSPWERFNHLLAKTSLNNEYFVMRHGESEANVLGIVITDPATGTVSFGLTELGKQQAHDRASEARQKNTALNSDTIIISSDFLRARETAEIAGRELGVSSVQYEIKLRERGFGGWEGKSQSSYKGIWTDDRLDPFGKNNAIESVVEVMDRVSALVLDLEQRHSGKTFLLVAHGDPLLILQAAFEKVYPGTFRDLGKLANAEIRQMRLNPDVNPVVA